LPVYGRFFGIDSREIARNSRSPLYNILMYIILMYIRPGSGEDTPSRNQRRNPHDRATANNDSQMNKVVPRRLGIDSRLKECGGA
jgi:hypothetical protein